MHDVHLELLQQGIALHKEKKFAEAEQIYHRLLNRYPFQEDLLYLVSDLYLRRDWNGVAIVMLAALLQNNPKRSDAWCNIGAAFRKENEYDRARAAWMRAIEMGGETMEVCNNLAGLYGDRGEPEKALEWLDKALAKGDNAESRWQKALALLSLRRDEGWPLYEARQELEQWDSRKKIEVPIWDGKPVDHLYIHGEQGVGDEIMFASAIPHVLPYAKEITLEVNPKVAGIVKQTWPQFHVVKEETPGKYDAKVPIASLLVRFGINPLPYLKPHPAKVAHYRRALEDLGPAPYVALTWVGGVKSTRCEDRTIALKDWKPLRDRYTCVSAQYEDTNPYIGPEREKEGLPKISDESCGLDLHDQAALFRAVDAVVTVQQTAVHVAGAVGANTIALIGERPHWRYGIEGDKLPFYSSVKMVRKTSTWEEAVARVEKELDADFRSLQRAKQAIA